MIRSYRVTIDDNPKPDWLVILEIALFIVVLPLGILYLIIKGIVKLSKKSKERRREKKMAPIMERMYMENQIKEERQSVMNELRQLSSLVNSGAVKPYEVEGRRRELVRRLSQLNQQ